MNSVKHVRGWLAMNLGTAAALAVLLGANVARAHISLEQAQPPTHLSRYGDGELKEGPCGRAGGTRGTNVYTYEPGQTITVNVQEFIPHSGYFRIAFDEDGDDDFLDPQSIDPVERQCQTDEPRCGESDFYNNAAVLPDLDDLEPHGSNTQAKTWSWDVTLPDVECDHCTLQIIQVMEDHGKYLLDNDVYHTCIDLVLKHGASPDAGPMAGDGDGDGTVPDGDGDGTTGDGDGTVGDGDGTVGDGSSDGSDDGAGDGYSGGDGDTDGSPATGGTTSSGTCALGPHQTSYGVLAAVGLGLTMLGLRRRRRR
jgi:hypothetical protein